MSEPTLYGAVVVCPHKPKHAITISHDDWDIHLCDACYNTVIVHVMRDLMDDAVQSMVVAQQSRVVLRMEPE